MKFRGKTTDIANIHYFTKVVATVAKLAKSCVLRLTPQNLYFISLEHKVVGGAGVWCELSQENVFDEYLLEGVNVNTANEIYLSINTDNLVNCLKCSHNANSLKLKLSRKALPCLTVEVEQPTLFGTSRKVVHDVSVDLVERRNWSEYSKPNLPNFKISIYMPQLKMAKNVIERMKNLSDYVTISANLEGEMVFKIEKELVTVSTHFENLSYPVWAQPASQGSSGRDFVEANVDIKKIFQLLSGQQISSTNVVCSIVPNQMVHIGLTSDGVSLQYFLPSVSVD